MEVDRTQLDGVLLLRPETYHDNRGYFFESFNSKNFLKITGIKTTFVQDNQSYSKRGVLRGLHYQKEPMRQSKLVRCVKGTVRDVVVDIQPNSSTYGQWITRELSEENQKQLWVPGQYAHGFLTLSENAIVLYKTDNYYSVNHEVSINPLDKHLDIDWGSNTDFILSDRDLKGIQFTDLEI